MSDLRLVICSRLGLWLRSLEGVDERERSMKGVPARDTAALAVPSRQLDALFVRVETEVDERFVMASLFSARSRDLPALAGSPGTTCLGAAV